MPGLSPTSACIYTVVAAGAAFIAGRATSIHILGPNATSSASGQMPTNGVETHTLQPSQNAKAPGKPFSFPLPELLAGKDAPKTKYTSFVSSSVLSSTADYATLHLDTETSLNDEEEVCIQTDDGHSKCSIDSFKEEDYAEANRMLLEVKDDEEHLPAGQHLLIDIERVNSGFLNDEVRLAKAMVDVVNQSKLTLLSYHCHKLIPMGVSCVGVLLESHISFHTWPEAGVITLDLFTCGSGKLVPVLPNIKKLFGIPQEGARDIISEQPRYLWSHKYRGFRDSLVPNDLMQMVLEPSDFDLKEEIASVQTPFQRIDIYDLIEVGEDDYKAYERMKLGGDTYEARNPQQFNPNRIVFLDGVMQSEREGNAAYHEALVHPAMFLHPYPKRAAIIGGGEGATLREVLKHSTIDKVTMVEIDELMVTVSREFLPDWNNCTDLVGGADWCGDDERADMYYVDAFGWFNDRFAEGVDIKKEDRFDVLIMDALDPEDDIPFASMLYNNIDFIQTLYNSLTDDGLIVLQLGEASNFDDPAAELSRSSRRETLIELLEEVGFESMHFYEDGNCGFDAPWTFLIATKDEDIDYRWYASEAAVEIDIRNRIVKTESGAPALKYFDGGVKKLYHNPSKASEVVFCRTEPMPESCRSLDNERRVDIPITDLYVGMSTVGDGSGRGLFTSVDIKQGATIARAMHTSFVYAPWFSLRLLLKYDFDDVVDYLSGYGWLTETHGGYEYFVEPSILTFSNHGCNGTFNIYDTHSYGKWTTGELTLLTEQNATIGDYHDYRDEVFDLFTDRHMGQSALSYSVAKRDINGGEELFSDYLWLGYAGDKEWFADVMDLKKICRGEIGFITEQENKKLK